MLSEQNCNHIVHFGVLARPLQQLERSYSMTVFSGTLELQEEIANVDVSAASAGSHFISHCKGLSSQCAHMSAIHLRHSALPWDGTGVLQIHQTSFANITHQVSMLLPCSRRCGKGKVQVNGLLPKSKVFCSWVYQNTNVATTSKWRNDMPCMEVCIEGLLNWDPAKGTSVFSCSPALILLLLLVLFFVFVSIPWSTCPFPDFLYSKVTLPSLI